MAFIVLLLVILAIYFYGKRLAHNASVKGLPYSPPKKHGDAVDTPQKGYSKLTPPPLPPPPPKRDANLSRDENIRPHPIFSDYLISYCDRNGFKTERRITIQSIDGELIYAYCHLRHDRRSFYVSRVSKWTNCNSGEIISDIFDDLNTARKNSPYGVIDRMLEDLYPIMGALLYLCKGDKRLMINERNILIKVFHSLCDDARLTDEMISDGIDEMMVPSRTKFKSLLKELASMDDSIKSIAVEASEQIFSSRRKLNPIEEEALTELNKRLTSKK